MSGGLEGGGILAWRLHVRLDASSSRRLGELYYFDIDISRRAYGVYLA